jgi:hypothetical protein
MFSSSQIDEPGGRDRVPTTNGLRKLGGCPPSDVKWCKGQIQLAGNDVVAIAFGDVNVSIGESAR